MLGHLYCKLQVTKMSENFIFRAMLFSILFQDWSVGKVIDHVAAMFRVKNTNHQSMSEAKLVMLSSEEKELDVKQSLSSQQTTGSNIQLFYTQLD